MTDENRAELMQGIEAVVRAAMSDVDEDGVQASNLPISRGGQDNIIGQVVGVRVRTQTVDSSTIPDLPPEKVFALKVLVGDPDTLVVALADYLIDAGHEYATAVAERARMDERDRIAGVLRAEAATLIGRRPENDLDNYAAGALETVAEDLLLTIPR